MPIIIQQTLSTGSSTLLQIIQAACAELMIHEPNHVIGNPDQQTKQMLALLQRLGTDLSRQHNWQGLVKTHEFTTSDNQFSYPLPIDWLSQIPQTEWDKTNRWPLNGPATDQQWQVYKSALIGQGPRTRFRISGNAVEVDPVYPGYDISFFYISKNWIASQEGFGKAKFTSDTDSTIFPDSLLITGLKTAWKSAKGLDGTFDLAEFRVMLDTIKAQDKSAPKLSLSPQPGEVLLSVANFSDGNWPG